MYYYVHTYFSIFHKPPEWFRHFDVANLEERWALEAATFAAKMFTIHFCTKWYIYFAIFIFIIFILFILFHFQQRHCFSFWNGCVMKTPLSRFKSVRFSLTWFRSELCIMRARAGFCDWPSLTIKICWPNLAYFFRSHPGYSLRQLFQLRTSLSPADAKRSGNFSKTNVMIIFFKIWLSGLPDDIFSN
jgi:hypothetical protein